MQERAIKLNSAVRVRARPVQLLVTLFVTFVPCYIAQVKPCPDHMFQATSCQA